MNSAAAADRGVEALLLLLLLGACPRPRELLLQLLLLVLRKRPPERVAERWETVTVLLLSLNRR